MRRPEESFNRAVYLSVAVFIVVSFLASIAYNLILSEQLETTEFLLSHTQQANRNLREELGICKTATESAVNRLDRF